MDNNSGHQPVEFKVLLKPDEFPEVTGGGIIIPATVRDRYALARTRATIIAVGGNPGDIVRVIRKSTTAGKYVAYRYVV